MKEPVNHRLPGSMTVIPVFAHWLSLVKKQLQPMNCPVAI